MIKLKQGQHDILKISELCESVFKRKYRIHDEDVISDAFLKIVLQFQASKDKILNFDAWVIGAIHHQFCNFIRQKEINKRINFVEELQDYLLVSNDEPVYDTQNQIEHIKNEINKLKNPYKEIIKSRIFENKDYKEISLELNIKENTLRKYFQRACEDLSKNIIFCHILILTATIWVRWNI